jgi:hypothetical protein
MSKRCNQLKIKNMSTTKKKVSTPKTVVPSPIKKVCEGPSKDDVINALIEENNALRSAQEPKSKPEPISQPLSFAVLLGELDNQLSRYYNGLNNLDNLAEKLKSSTPVKSDIAQNQPPLPGDHLGRLDSLIGVFNHLNNRIEGTNGYLANII